MKRRAVSGLIALLAACQIGGPPKPDPEITAAVADLKAGGFEFEADVRITRDAYAVCDGLACAELRVVENRRTIGLAREALEDPSRVRASLLEIWTRYREPRPGSIPDLARGALLVVRRGPEVGVTNPWTLRLAYHSYQQLWLQLDRVQRAKLEDPKLIPLP